MLNRILLTVAVWRLYTVLDTTQTYLVVKVSLFWKAKLHIDKLKVVEAVWPSGCSTRLVIWPHVSKPSTLLLTGFILISVALSSAPCLCFVYNQLVCLRQVWISNHFTPKSDNLLTFLTISALNLKLRLHVYSGKDFLLKKALDC